MASTVRWSCPPDTKKGKLEMSNSLNSLLKIIKGCFFKRTRLNSRLKCLAP